MMVGLFFFVRFFLILGIGFWQMFSVLIRT